MQAQTFNFHEPLFEITKSYSENGQMFVEGVAATTDIDLTQERMSPEVIAKMAAGLINKPLRSEHGKGWDDELGKIVEARVVDDPNGNPALWIKARLFDWSSKARDLFHVITNGVKKMGLSVAGKIKPGGLVDEMVDNIGKWIPTYKDVEPTEVSVTDHPANISTFALAVTKSLNEQASEMMKDYEEELKKDHECEECEGELCMHDKCFKANCSNKCGACNGVKKSDRPAKPEQYEDIPDDKFLDPDNYRYPADDKHLLPALRYFNRDGQRDKGGYDDKKWGQMGNRLASFLGEGYKYDASSEKVVKEETKKNMEGGDFSYMDSLKTKKLSPEVQGFIKDFMDLAPKNSPLSRELAEMQKSQEEEVKEAEAKKAEKAEKSANGGEVSGEPEVTTPAADPESKPAAEKAEDMSETVTPEAMKAEETETPKTETVPAEKVNKAASLSEIESMLSTIAGSLESLKDGSPSGSDSDGSKPSDEKTGSDKSGSEDSRGSAGSGDLSHLESLMNSLGKAQDSVKELLAVKKENTEPASSKVESDSSVPVSNPQDLSKALTGVVGLVETMAKTMKEQKEESDKVIKSLVEKIDSMPTARKGKAFVMEKNLDGSETTPAEDGKPVEKSYEELIELMKSDSTQDERGNPVIGFQEIHKFQMYGTDGYLPKAYKGKYTVKAIK